MKSWYEFYEDRVCKSYFDYINKKYKLFIDEIVNIINSNSSNMVEVGCGIGSITKSVIKLSDTARFSPIILLDQSKKMLSLTKQNLFNE